MDSKIEKLERVFKFGDDTFDDPNPAVSHTEAIKILANLNPQLSTYANGHAVFDKREGDVITYQAKKSVADKG